MQVQSMQRDPCVCPCMQAAITSLHTHRVMVAQVANLPAAAASTARPAAHPATIQRETRDPHAMPFLQLAFGSGRIVHQHPCCSGMIQRECMHTSIHMHTCIMSQKRRRVTSGIRVPSTTSIGDHKQQSVSPGVQPVLPRQAARQQARINTSHTMASQCPLMAAMLQRPEPVIVAAAAQLGVPIIIRGKRRRMDGRVKGQRNVTSGKMLVGTDPLTGTMKTGSGAIRLTRMLMMAVGMSRHSATGSSSSSRVVVRCRVASGGTSRKAAVGMSMHMSAPSVLLLRLHGMAQRQRHMSTRTGKVAGEVCGMPDSSLLPARVQPRSHPASVTLADRCLLLTDPWVDLLMPLAGLV